MDSLCFWCSGFFGGVAFCSIALVTIATYFCSPSSRPDSEEDNG